MAFMGTVMATAMAGTDGRTDAALYHGFTRHGHNDLVAFLQEKDGVYRGFIITAIGSLF